jgi:hypothetical protein
MSCSASDFVSRVAPEVIGADQILIENAIQDSIIEFCKESFILQRGMQFSVTSDDVGETNDAVDLDLSDKLSGLRPESILALNIDGIDYDVVYREDLDDLTYLSQYHGDGEKFYNIPDNSTIQLYPMGASTVYLRVAVVPTRAADTYPDEILEDWMEAIAFGAKYRLMAMQRKKWTTGTGSQVNQTYFRQEIGKAKQTWRKNRSSKSTSVNPRTFGSHL